MSQDTSHDPASAQGNGHMHELPPCACCMALAHVRLPNYNGGGSRQPADPPLKETARARKASPFLALPKFNFGGKSKGKKGAAEAAAAAAPEPEWDEELLGPKPRKLWQGLDGIAILLFGVVLPTLLTVSTFICLPKRLTLVILNHPLETLTELALVVLLPLVNLMVWSALCKHKLNRSKLASLALGMGIGSGLIISGVAVAAMFAPNPDSPDGAGLGAGLSWLAILAMLASATAAYLTFRVRQTRAFSAVRSQIIAFGAMGVALSLVAFAAAEVRTWQVRYAENLALSHKRAEHMLGMSMLQKLNPEHELHMECADTRASGLPGLFMPIKQANLHQLYFAVTGTPYSFHETKNVDLSAMPDDYLSRNIVGDEIAGLSLTRSTLNAVLHPRAMSSSVYWTFVFKNDTSRPQEARAEIALPPGAVVYGMTAWKKGETLDATIGLTERTEAVYESTRTEYGSIANVSDVGHGRVLLHCYEVPQDQELKIRLAMAVPLTPESIDSASAVLPRFIATNFNLDGDQQISLRSTDRLNSSIKSLTAARTAAGDYTLSGLISADDLKSPRLQVSTGRTAGAAAVAVYDPVATAMAVKEQRRKEAEEKRKRADELAQEERENQQVVLMLDGSRAFQTQIDAVRHALKKKHAAKVVSKPVAPRYVIESVEKAAAAAPKYLVVVIDGSQCSKAYCDQMKEALAKLPATVPTDVMVASQEHPELAHPLPLSQALKTINANLFIGGQDNLQCVVQAAELAGQTKGGAVLWLHGPQPALNEAVYIMSPYVAAPQFCELTLGTEDLDTTELFKNHPEIGPFNQIQRNSDKISDDLSTFFSRWSKDNSSYAVKYELTSKSPAKSEPLSIDEQREVLTLHAAQKCSALLREKHRNKAAIIAARYGLVTPLSYSFISPEDPNKDADDTGNRSTFDAFSTAPATAAATPTTVMPAAEAAISAPQLQGATNGCIGPQGTDATVISGVNTAGTVRVNNLANLEAMLNIFANLGEILLLAIGGMLTVHGFANKGTVVEIGDAEIEFSPVQRIGFGIMVALSGLALPGIINWFVASDRDANLFS